MSDVKQNRDGTFTVTVAIPAPDEWATKVDTAFTRLYDFCTAANRWHFVSLSVPSYSYGYICVLEKSAPTQSMSGASGLAAAVAGYGSTQVEAIDSAIELARLVP